MYIKQYVPDLFTHGGHYRFYKDGVLVGLRDHDETKIRLIKPVSFQPEISRAQGYRYWEKHFAKRPYYTLPELLEEAVNKEAIYRGHFIDKYGERVTIYG